MNAALPTAAAPGPSAPAKLMTSADYRESRSEEHTSELQSR